MCVCVCAYMCIHMCVYMSRNETCAWLLGLWVGGWVGGFIMSYINTVQAELLFAGPVSYSPAPMFGPRKDPTADVRHK